MLCFEKKVVPLQSELIKKQKNIAFFAIQRNKLRYLFKTDEWQLN